jgi:hypothetical protein
MVSNRLSHCRLEMSEEAPRGALEDGKVKMEKEQRVAAEDRKVKMENGERRRRRLEMEVLVCTEQASQVRRPSRM